MADVLGEKRAQLLDGHGANVTGGSLKETIIATVYFVMNAQYQLQALQIGDPEYFTGPKQMVENTIDDVILHPIAMDRMWEYLCNQLPEADRIDD
jgi:ribulose-5-phosphate 4-epimerase/fuculose-1-phosphate aldolase